MSVFEEIWRNNAWGEPTTPSGPGSSREATARLRGLLPALIWGLRPRRVLDAGCGLYGWLGRLPGYVGVDVVDGLIRQNQRAHPDVEFLHADICWDWLPPVDLVLCRDVLMHMSIVGGRAALENLRRTGATWLIATTFDEGCNTDVPDGEFYRIDLQAEPFAMGRPWCVLPDDWRWDDKVLGVWALA
jgi:SAM-dependent methyltransferase